MKYLHAKDKIKAPSSERAKEGIPCRILFHSLRSPKRLLYSRPDKHSDLGGKINFLGYGNGCCRGFSPRFPYPRIHRQSSAPDNAQKRNESRYSFVFYTFYIKNRHVSRDYRDKIKFFFRSHREARLSQSSVDIPLVKERNAP